MRYLKRGIGPKTAERFEKLGIVDAATSVLIIPVNTSTLYDDPTPLRKHPARHVMRGKGRGVCSPAGASCTAGGGWSTGHSRGWTCRDGDHLVQQPYAAQKLGDREVFYFQGHRHRRDAAASDGQPAGAHCRTGAGSPVRGRVPPDRGPFPAVPLPSACGSCCPMPSFCPTRCRRRCAANTACLPRPKPCGPSTALPPEEEAFAARRRLIYEELLVLQLGIGRMKNCGSAATVPPCSPPTRNLSGPACPSLPPVLSTGPWMRS